MKKLLIVGMGRSGKDTALDYLASITTLRNAGTTSKYLTKYVARELGVSEEKAYAERHQNRQFWKDLGDSIRQGDPTLLIREALAEGDMTGGVRDVIEIAGAREEKLFDLIIWVQNDRVPVDPTVTFGPEHCDVIVQNNGALQEFYEKLDRLAKYGGLPLKGRGK